MQSRPVLNELRLFHSTLGAASENPRLPQLTRPVVEGEPVVVGVGKPEH